MKEEIHISQNTTSYHRAHSKELCLVISLFLSHSLDSSFFFFFLYHCSVFVVFHEINLFLSLSRWLLTCVFELVIGSSIWQTQKESTNKKKCYFLYYFFFRFKLRLCVLFDEVFTLLVLYEMCFKPFSFHQVWIYLMHLIRLKKRFNIQYLRQKGKQLKFYCVSKR